MKEHFIVFARATAALDHSGIPYVVGGGIATWAYGRRRHTKDIDVFLRRKDAERALRVLREVGFRTEHADERWLYKAYLGDSMVDVIFENSRGFPVDEVLLARGALCQVNEHRFRVMAPEDLIVFKLLSAVQESPHWEDCLSIVRGLEGRLDWPYLLRRGSAEPCIILSFLLYAHWALGDAANIPFESLQALARQCGLLRSAA